MALPRGIREVNVFSKTKLFRRVPGALIHIGFYGLLANG